jgi:hypothetical protein
VTNLSAAIAAIRTQMFTSSAGSRTNVIKIAVIFIDGQSISETDAVQEAILARQAGITLLVVGIGAGGQKLPEWLGVASFPTSVNVFNVANYTLLSSIVSTLSASIGRGKFSERFFSLLLVSCSAAVDIFIRYFVRQETSCGVLCCAGTLSIKLPHGVDNVGVNPIVYIHSFNIACIRGLSGLAAEYRRTAS